MSTQIHDGARSSRSTAEVEDNRLAGTDLVILSVQQKHCFDRLSVERLCELGLKLGMPSAALKALEAHATAQRFLFIDGQPTGFVIEGSWMRGVLLRCPLSVRWCDAVTRRRSCRSCRTPSLTTRGSLDTLDLLVQKCESSTGSPLAEPLKVVLVQRVLNHLVMHATRLNTYASVCGEVRNIMLTRATLMNTAQPMDIGALDKAKGRDRGKGKKGDSGKNKAKGNG